MIESTRPKLNRFKYAGMLLGALAVAAFPPVGLTAVATAEREWDIGAYDQCIKDHPNSPYGCCYKTGGEWSGDDVTGKCVAPGLNSVLLPQGTSQPQHANVGPTGSVATAGNPTP